MATAARDAQAMRPSSRPRRRHGFTLLEVMVVVLIISVLAMVAMPALAHLKRKARTTAIVNDFRTFAAAFDTYAHETGRWPGETAAGAFPGAMNQRLNRTAWLRTTPMGGKYNWESNQMHFGTRYRAAIAISATGAAPLPLDVTQLTDLEETIDRGGFNWLGGNFHLGTGLVPLFIIQQ